MARCKKLEINNLGGISAHIRLQRITQKTSAKPHENFVWSEFEDEFLSCESPVLSFTVAASTEPRASASGLL